MLDTIIKGTGNSRTLASVPNFLTLYPTYEAFAQALVDKTLPIDIGDLNSEGLIQRGSKLTTANLLKGTTAKLYGKTTAAVPDDIFAAIHPILSAAETNASLSGKLYYGESVAAKNISSMVITLSRKPVWAMAISRSSAESRTSGVYISLRPNWMANIYSYSSGSVTGYSVGGGPTTDTLFTDTTVKVNTNVAAGDKTAWIAFCE